MLKLSSLVALYYFTLTLLPWVTPDRLNIKLFTKSPNYLNKWGLSGKVAIDITLYTDILVSRNIYYSPDLC